MRLHAGHSSDFFVLFSLETNVRASEWMEGTKTVEGSIYVWQVFGEDNLIPRALPWEEPEAPLPFSDGKALRKKL